MKLLGCGVDSSELGLEVRCKASPKFKHDQNTNHVSGCDVWPNVLSRPQCKGQTSAFKAKLYAYHVLALCEIGESHYQHDGQARPAISSNVHMFNKLSKAGL